jgi:hypothetical protein
MINPATEIVNPFTVHWGLLYINEDCGPIIELLCATNIIPAIISINPTTSNILTRIDFLIVMKILSINVLLIYKIVILVLCTVYVPKKT